MRLALPPGGGLSTRSSEREKVLWTFGAPCGSGHGGTFPPPARGFTPRLLAARTPPGRSPARRERGPLLVVVRRRPVDRLDARLRANLHGLAPRLVRGSRACRGVAGSLDRSQEPSRSAAGGRKRDRGVAFVLAHARADLRRCDRPAVPVPRDRIHGGVGPHPIRNRVPVSRVDVRPHPRAPWHLVRSGREIPRTAIQLPREGRGGGPFRRGCRDDRRDPPEPRRHVVRPVVERGSRALTSDGSDGVPADRGGSHRPGSAGDSADPIVDAAPRGSL